MKHNRLIKTLLFSCLGLLQLSIYGCKQRPVEQETHSNTSSVKDTRSVESENENNTFDYSDMTQDQVTAVKSLLWADKANPDKDFMTAVNKNDLRLWVVATRALTVPGVDNEQQSKLLQLCGQKYLPGVGDVLLNEQHRKLYTKAITFAESYNKKMSVYCLSRKQ